jgi:Fe-S cluster assembly protein SufD
MLDVIDEKSTYFTDFARLEKSTESAPAWIRDVRHAAMERFEELGFPTLRDEEWRFTNLAPLVRAPFEFAEQSGNALGKHSVVATPDLPLQLAVSGLRAAGRIVRVQADALRLVCVNGRFSEELSSLDGLPSGLIVSSLATAIRVYGKRVESHLGQYAAFEDQAFTALNTAFLQDGVFIFVPKGMVLERPLSLVFLTVPTDRPLVSHPRTLVLLEAGSQATIVESYVGIEPGAYFTNAVTEAVVGSGAVLDHYKLQREGRSAFHIATLQLQQERDSQFSSHLISGGGSLVRNDVNAVLAAEGCTCTLNGLSMATGRQHVDNHTLIEHAKPHCTSHELYKCILDDQAHGVFNGKILVHQDAQKTDAKQTNQTLLLSEEATINTKPQLEIFADDVKCTHGATVGQLDDEAIFYLRSRGIDAAAARTLLTYAFANDVIGRIQVEPVRRYLEEQLLATQRLPSAEAGEEAP